MLDHLVYALPLPLLGLLLIAACLAASELGVWVRKRASRAPSTPGTDHSDARGYIVSAIFGLLGFMVALTFSIAVDRFDSRRALVTEEANAIGTAYLRASLFDAPQAASVQAALRDYAHSRIAPEGVWNERMEAQMQRSTGLRTRVWDEARTAILPVRETDQASYFVEAVNDMLDIGTRRQLLGPAHIPMQILDVLLIFLLVSSGVLGYLVGGRNTGQRLGAGLLLTLFSLAIVLILDLDRPRSGTIQIPQTALLELVATLDQEAQVGTR